MESDNYWHEEWNELTKKNIRDGFRGDAWNSKMADYCEEIMLKAKKAYYEGDPIMSDYRYDNTEETLRNLRPNSPVLEKVG